MNVKEVLGAFSLVNNPIVLSEEEVKDVQKAIKELQQENKKLNGAIQTYDILLKTNVEENKQLKEVIEEVREYVEKTPIGSILEVHCGDEEEYTKPLLQILDKAKDNDA